MKTIAIFHPSSELYGADRILVNALNAMPKDIKKIVYLKFEGALINYIQKNIENVEVKKVDILPIIYRKIFSPTGIFKFANERKKFKRFFQLEHQKHQFYSAYVNTLSCSFILPLLKKLDIKNLIHVHEIIDSPKLIGKITAKMAVKYSDKIICVSSAVEKGLIKYSRRIQEKSMILHNGIEPIKTIQKPRSETLHFYLFGRIMHKKGQWLLIEALAKLDKEIIASHQFVLMGGVIKGNEHVRKSLEEQIVQLGLENNVQIKSFASNISEAMSNADICLVPSVMKDPFPTTVLEAMSAGKPVITSDHGGAKEAIESKESGILFNHKKPQELTDAIAFLIQNRNKVEEIGTKAKTRFNTLFTIQHFNQNWNEMLIQNSFI
ncbi:MAG: glycosyltransferase involved in cell wall biosynthesis [Parvicella sp.]|jgi:glycosyltransferase involved in cell wall biosynthesis